MNNDRWWIWVVVFVLFMLLRGLVALFKNQKKAGDGMARLNAAAERILKQRAGNPIPRTKPAGAAPMKPKGPKAGATSSALLKVTRSPAVVRRDGLLASGREPVIQRRH